MRSSKSSSGPRRVAFVRLLLVDDLGPCCRQHPAGLDFFYVPAESCVQSSATSLIGNWQLECSPASIPLFNPLPADYPRAARCSPCPHIGLRGNRSLCERATPVTSSTSSRQDTVQVTRAGGRVTRLRRDRASPRCPAERHAALACFSVELYTHRPKAVRAPP